ncbi:hypothetical protein B0H13DRAFT_2429864, partial [Mycena leptocephala]
MEANRGRIRDSQLSRIMDLAPPGCKPPTYPGPSATASPAAKPGLTPPRDARAPPLPDARKCPPARLLLPLPRLPPEPPAHTAAAQRTRMHPAPSRRAPPHLRGRVRSGARRRAHPARGGGHRRRRPHGHPEPRAPVRRRPSASCRGAVHAPQDRDRERVLRRPRCAPGGCDRRGRAPWRGQVCGPPSGPHDVRGPHAAAGPVGQFVAGGARRARALCALSCGAPAGQLCFYFC